MDVSIIIAHRDINVAERNNVSPQPIGLWATIHSLELDLINSGLEYEFCIQTNGVKKLHIDTFTVLEYAKKAGIIGYHGHSEEVMAAPLARQEAVNHAKGKYLFFFDNHVMVKPGYFKQAIKSMEEYNMDMLHSTTIFFHGSPVVYHYDLTLEKNFWATGADAPLYSDKPYRIAAGGHGGFVIRADVFREVGGYWNGFKGYGGEEIYFDIKMALLGKTNWIDPNLIHYHYAGNRGYPRHYTDDFYTNMMAVANIIGGYQWVEKVYDSFAKKFSKLMSGKTLFDLMDEAIELSQPHADELSKIRLCSLEEQLVYFKENNIPH